MKLDQVGSFLREEKLKQARKDFEDKKIDLNSLRNIENECIKNLLKKCDEIGLYYLSDGELRRSWWHLDFYWQLDGVIKIIKEQGYAFKGLQTRAEGLKIVDKISCKNHNFINDFKELIKIAKQLNIDISRLKLTIPSPSMFLYMLFVRGKNETNFAYYNTNYSLLKDDILQAYKDFYELFFEAGGRYLQLDDTSYGSLCDDEFCKINELDYEKTCLEYVDFLNQSLSSMPKGLTSAIHICRGNYRSRYAASGAYSKIAHILFKDLKIDKFFLEFDDERSGGFEALKYIQNQEVVLGILTTKTIQNPSLEDLEKRVLQASSYMDKKQLSISTQCGFSSTEEGNEISIQTQWDKILLLKELANRLNNKGFNI
ncbi:5-methyltetrahydropteroyltriglutamate--homocysteine S-methyltransferase [Campylobacter canadensis]|uniref:5-methyltetrahydropteroyltriglutamate--homocysteine S-methyltransferase n=1 Tax=Campylobacter canadensis TaxID=449520 RepID=A0ABS7WPH2_9BACT|nr:5-methyltetrahydropteroyltriglutamate--homocysteine S-methyltransferase [Campylobacter canadensis]MBZ7986666.1 5-methyltetrahydropteroyltriglutamate--homocysteine S-methyltransferase [Campylobacter canadensis]MBZ7993929.1 5-methyltetrahydropteroyltriglutamate--homocysteine S-methyltransferase [Campylobacter canadensis]MBZ7996245.1 5-methyltetrahydropteroyltriglutamate--homocysteine S-methyltransferase [Campylobacter canadensis]MBZ7997702.1 5-methyltetrahydropteroyltriglutamate--homocysteine 